MTDTSASKPQVRIEINARMAGTTYTLGSIELTSFADKSFADLLRNIANEVELTISRKSTKD